MKKELRVVLANKTVLTTGRKGPDFSPFRETPANLIKELTNTKPMPVFKYADNLNRAITLEELQNMLKLTTATAKVEVKIEAPKAPIELDKLDEDNKEIETGSAGDDGAGDGTFEELGELKIDAEDSTDMNELPPATGEGSNPNGQSQKQRNRR